MDSRKNVNRRSGENPQMLNLLNSIKEGEQTSDKDLSSIARFIINQMKDDGVAFIGNKGPPRSTETSFANSEGGYSDIGSSASEKEEKHMISLMSGDLIWLRNDDPSCRGIMLGDESLRTVGVEPYDATSSVTPRFAEGLFRICVGLNYRSKTEVGMIKKAIYQSEHKQQIAVELNPQLAEKRRKLEASQNAEQMDRLSRGEGTEPIKYGDIVELQHVRSGLFVATHKTPAPLNPSCRKVTLKPGSFASQFRILPRFKVRSKGSLVYVDDQIQLQGMKFDHLRLGVSPPPGRQVGSFAYGSLTSEPAVEPDPFSDVDEDKLKSNVKFYRQPTTLKRQATCEVNGSMDPYQCFTVKLYHRHHKRAVLLTGHYFRLYHPEANAHVQASANPDKGVVLDATGATHDPLSFMREGNTPAHIAYMKPFVSSYLASNPIHLCAKAIWCFESLDPTHCHEIRFDVPFRLRHVPSGKLLSVNTSVTAALNEPRDGICYDAALVHDVHRFAEEGALGSASSMLFYLTPTDVASDTLKRMVASVRLQHRTYDNRVLHFVSTKETKPQFVGRNMSLEEEETVISKEIGYRLLFSTQPSSLDVIKIEPLSVYDSAQVSKLISRIRCLKNYAYLWQTAGSDASEPLAQAITVVGQCFDILDDIKKKQLSDSKIQGATATRRFDGSITEAMSDAAHMPPLQFSNAYAQDVNPRLQKVAYEVKLLDAVFEATLAPYNHAALKGKANPFRDVENSDALCAVQKFLFVTVQNLVRDNLGSQAYFSRCTSRVWKREDNFIVNPMTRQFDLWHNIIIDQVEDALGATVTLGQLLRSSEKIVKKLVNFGIMDRFKKLVAKCGPDIRFINIFTAVCFVEGKPSRSNQEMCLRKLWMNTPDRYSFLLTFHEGIDQRGTVMPDGTVMKKIPQRSRVGAAYAKNTPKAFLGRTDENVFNPICIAWSSSDEWKANCGALWWSPKSMKLPVVCEVKEEGVDASVHYVPIEHLMWVLEPYQLCKPVTGKYWKPFLTASQENAAASPFAAKSGKSIKMKKMTSLFTDASTEYRMKVAKEKFERQVKLANYVIAEFELLTNMCKGRSYNCIRMLEKSFSYGMLMNLATNPYLPSKFTATVIGFIDALYVNRFPQMPYGGAPCLPEKLWVFEDKMHKKGMPRASTTPILKTELKLTSEEAFPAFFVPYHSSVYGGDDPVLSHPDHFKFFLLRTFCNDSLRKFDITGRLTHSQGDINQFKMSVIRAQASLLSFGFQSTLIKLKDIFVTNAMLLDGRRDLKMVETPFNPPESRYTHTGQQYETVTKLKVALINSFNELVDLRTNFRLGQLLHLFKQKVNLWNAASAHSKHLTMADIVNLKEAQYILQSTPEAITAMYEDFEAMFPGGSGEANQLDLAALCQMPDIDLALVDAIMYEDDDLLAGALKLLESTYGQRRQLRRALNEVFLLDDTYLPVYGDIHVLRAQISEIMYLVRTSSSWGVKSRISGLFEDRQFGTVMSILDRLHAFIYADEKDEESTKWNDDPSNYSDFFKETGLDGEYYECANLWSVDVAAKWSSKIVAKTGKTSANMQHQNLLQSCNFQSVLYESIHMDSDIALKGSICTDREKYESQRRLTLVKRAFLSVSIGFTSGNRKNQEFIFPHIDAIEQLATPPFMKAADGVPELSILAPWPSTVSDLSQALILSILRFNESLCAQVKASLLHLFATIADHAPDPSVSPALEFFFICAKPEFQAKAEFQLRACERLFGLQRLKKRGVFEAMNVCLSQGEPNLSPSTEIKDQSEVKLKVSPPMKLADPARFVRLALALMEGGNERVASQLKHIAELDIDSVCTTILNELQKANLKGKAGELRGVSVDKYNPIFEFLSNPKGLASGLMDLLVELVFLLPLNADQMASRPLWEFFQLALVPVFGALAQFEAMDANEASYCGELVGMTELLLFTLSRLGMFKLAMENPVKKRIVSQMADSVEAILEKRYKPPEHLELAFRQMIDEYGVEALSLSQFIKLVEKLMAETAGKEPTDEERKKKRKEIADAFIDADIDGNGEINLYEFVQLYGDVSKTGGHDASLTISAGDVLQKEGHRLNLRTVECCSRIINIRNGFGSALGVMRFSRGDKYGSRVRKIETSTKLAVGAQKGPKKHAASVPILSKRMRQEFKKGEVSLQAKFEVFQKGIDKNPKILEALLRRRFALVSVLEKGSKGSTYQGPEEEDKEEETVLESLYNSMAAPISGPGGLMKRRSSMFTSRKVQVVPAKGRRKFGHSISNGQDIPEIEMTFSAEQEKAALVIQRSFRCMMAHAEMVHRKERIKIYGIGDKKSGVKLPRNTVELNWRGVTSRFVKYVSDHYWESGQEGDVCVLILDIWYNHLVKARTYFIDINGVQLPESQLHLAKTLKFIEPRDLAPHERELYHQKQSQLNELGVTVLLSHLISDLANDLQPGGLPSVAIKLFTELLNAGNSDVQECLFTHLVEGDDEGKLILYLEGRLNRGFEAMADAKKRGVIGSNNEAMMEDIKESYELLMQTARFIQLLCEGHHLGFQDYMRTQPMHTASHVNLVRVVANIVVLLCDSSYIVSHFTSMEISLISQLLKFLIECVQGPCTGNQDLVGKSDVVASMNSIICARIAKDEERSAREPLYVDLKSLSCTLLASMLEAREDQTIHQQLARKLEIASFEDYRIALETRVYEILDLVKAEQRPRTLEETQEIQTKQGSLVAVWTVLIEINVKPASALRVEKKEQLVGLVEVAWRETVQRTCFALPFEIKYLTNTTKQKFMEVVDLSTAEKRMAELLDQTDLFISEMHIIFAKAETSKAYKYLYNNLRYFKLANYGLVFALNMNILLSPASLGSPSAIVAREMGGKEDHSDNPITRLEIYSVVVTTALGALVTIGYAVIVSTLAVTEIPLLIQELDADAKNNEPPTRHDIMMFWAPSLFGFCATFLFVFLHLLNNDPALGLYLAIFVILNVPLGFRAYRKTIGIAPTNKYLRYFAITYDVLFKRSFLRNHLVLMLCCFLGYFVNVEFFTLELLDVVAVSPVIADIIRSVTAPGFALGLVFYLFVITVIIYAAFGMNHFASSLMVPLEDGDGGAYEAECNSMLQCFYFIFHSGLSESGNMVAFLATNTAGDYEYPMRIMYDSVFFVWVGIVLVNIIVGLMVDTFSSIREEKQSRTESLNTICFVCGTLRRSYDDMDLPPDAPKFDVHIALEHDPWTYVFYLAYLKKKGSEDDSGIESYVRSEASKRSLNWIPVRTSFFMDGAKKKMKKLQVIE